jgi:hypothetical protein
MDILNILVFIFFTLPCLLVMFVLPGFVLWMLKQMWN